jgi:hypothetical protein
MGLPENQRPGAGEQSNAARSIAGLERLAVKFAQNPDLSVLRHKQTSNRRLSNTPRDGSPSAGAGSWDHASCRSWDRSDSDSRRYPDDRSPRLLQKSFHNCKGRETCGIRLELLFLVRTAFLSLASSRFFDRGHRALLALVRLQYLFPQAKRFRSNLDKFVIRDEFDRLFQVQSAERNQANGFVGG